MNDVPRTEHVKLERAGMRSSVVSAVMLFGMAKGVPREELIAATGVSMADLIDPEARLPDIVLAKAWRFIGDRFPGESVGLQMARAAPLSVFGPLAQAARFSPTRAHALEAFCRFDKVLSGGLNLSVSREGAHTTLVLSHELDAVDGGHGAEAAIGLGTRIGQDVLGLHERPARIEFVHAPIASVQSYVDWFGVPVRFEAGRNAVVFDSGHLELAPQQPNPEMYAFIQAHLDLVQRRLLAQVADAPLDRVRVAIGELAQRSDYSAESVAQKLGMSLRTLQRYTTKHGASLRTLIEEVREANARHLLSDDRLSVDEIAFLLGYADDRAFRRAFKRWTDSTPAAFRAARS